MILSRTSKDFRNYFLLAFTKELIVNSMPKDVLLEIAMKRPDEDIKIKSEPELKERVEERIFEESKKKFISPFEKPPIKKIVRREFKPLPQMPRTRQGRPLFTSLKIPKVRLPPHLQYIKPVPKEKAVDLGKLAPILKDPFVSVIECNGADEQIIARGRRGTKLTNVTLTQELIKQIINEFSQKSRIPVVEGVYRVVVGKLILSAIISEITGTKFVISKMNYR